MKIEKFNKNTPILKKKERKGYFNNEKKERGEGGIPHTDISYNPSQKAETKNRNKWDSRPKYNLTCQGDIRLSTVNAHSRSTSVTSVHIWTRNKWPSSVTTESVTQLDTSRVTRLEGRIGTSQQRGRVRSKKWRFDIDILKNSIRDRIVKYFTLERRLLSPITNSNNFRQRII